VLRAVMSCEPAVPNTHTCSIEVIGAHVPDGLKAGAMTALFIIIAGLGWKDCLQVPQPLGGRLRSEGSAHVVLDSASKYDPDDAHELVGKRDNGFVLSSSCNKLSDPLVLCV
jgi:hypothetical protein